MTAPNFQCHKCGALCAIAPEKAVCPACCEGHDYKHDRNRRGRFCVHCDWQDLEPYILEDWP